MLMFKFWPSLSCPNELICFNLWKLVFHHTILIFVIYKTHDTWNGKTYLNSWLNDFDAVMSSTDISKASSGLVSLATAKKTSAIYIFRYLFILCFIEQKASDMKRKSLTKHWKMELIDMEHPWKNENKNEFIGSEWYLVYNSLRDLFHAKSCESCRNIRYIFLSQPNDESK